MVKVERVLVLAFVLVLAIVSHHASIVCSIDALLLYVWCCSKRHRSAIKAPSKRHGESALAFRIVHGAFRVLSIDVHALPYRVHALPALSMRCRN